MSRLERVYVNGEYCGDLSTADWGVVFHPAEGRQEFAELRVLTWETQEAAKHAIKTIFQGKEGHGP